MLRLPKCLSVAVLLVVALEACAQDDSLGESSEAPTTVSTPAEVTTSVAAVAEPYAVDVAGPFSYMELPSSWYQEPLVDVYTPVGAGPWPVVAVYHGGGGTKADMESASVALAESGLVVFNFTWGGRSIDAGFKEALLDQGPCTLWYTFEEAASYGGDVSDVSMFGFSAGADMATGIVMKNGRGDVECAAAPSDAVPTRVISGEGDYFLAPDWNRVLGLDPSVAEVIPPWLYIEGYNGPPIHFLFDEMSRAVLAVADVPEGALADFIALRDKDGTLASELQARGALDDNVLDWGETTEYLHDRLVAAGATSTLTWTEYGVHELGPEMMRKAISLAGGDPATFAVDDWIAQLNK